MRPKVGGGAGGVGVEREREGTGSVPRGREGVALGLFARHCRVLGESEEVGRGL